MFKIHSVLEIDEGITGYMETKYFYIYYLITPSGHVEYEERYRKQQYKDLQHFKKVVLGFDRYCLFINPPLELSELSYNKLAEYYYENCL